MLRSEDETLAPFPRKVNLSPLDRPFY